MKRISILIVVVSTFIVGLAWAQEVYHGESFELNSTLSPNQSIEYKANDFIHLKKGFLSSPQSPNYAMMEIDPYFNLPTEFGNEIGLSPDHPSGTWGGNVGTIPMDFEINENGAATISIPLDFPEGINGMSPHLSLNYNSQGGDGIMGLGWSIGGMSKISRVPYTYKYNDSCGAVLFSDLDELSIDGNRLRKGADNKYYPEIYDFSVVHKISGGYKVLRKDGIVCEYKENYYLQEGNDALTEPIEWHLSKMEDPFGNAIHYHYHNNRGEGSFYPDFINYTYHDGVSPAYTIAFTYEEREDTPRKYFSSKDGYNAYHTGYSRISKILTSVACYYGNTKIIEYCLDYDYIGLWQEKGLNRVRKYCFNTETPNEDKMLSMTVFEWDGTVSLLKYERINDTLLFQTHYNSDNEWQQFALFAATFEEEHPLLNTSKYSSDIVHVQHVGNGTNPPIRYHVNVFRNGGSLNAENGQWSYNYNEQYDCSVINDFLVNWDIFSIMPADTDGDGLNEIVCVYGTKNANHEYMSVKIALFRKQENSSAFYVQEVPFADGGASNFDNFTIMDFNGDGRSDLFCTYGNQMFVYPSLENVPFSQSSKIDCGSQTPLTLTREIIVGDFYGNKKDQVLVMNKIDDNTAITRIYYGYHSGQTGTPTFLTPDFVNINFAEYFFKIDSDHQNHHFLWGDYNGDGKKDALVMQDNKWLFFFSKGNGQFTEAIEYNNAVIVHDTFVNTTSGGYHPMFHIADFDQDGCDDVSVSRFRYVNIPDPIHYDDWTYAGICRRDFLIHPKNNQVEVRKIGKYDHGTDVMIDSIKWSTYDAIDTLHFEPENFMYKSNAFLSCVSSHKGTSPTEILYSRMSMSRNSNDQNNIGAVFHVTGSLDNPPANQIEKIIDGLGATTEIEYSPYSYQIPFLNSMNGKDCDRNPIRKVIAYHGHLNVAQIVRKEMKDAESGGQKVFRETRYRFIDALYHTQGRGFLGFRKTWYRIQGENTTKDLQGKNTYLVDANYHILLPESSIKWRFNPLNGSPIIYDTTRFTFTFINSFAPELGSIPTGSTNGVFAPYLLNSVSKHNNDGPYLFEQESFSRDSYGNITIHRHSYGDSFYSFPCFEEVSLQYDYQIGASRWFTGIAKDETLTQCLHGETDNPVIRHTTYQNDINTGRHTEKCTEPGNEKQLTEVYAYDGFGNLITTTASGGGETRTESVTYSTDGRFPITKTNALGQTTTYTFDEATGRTESITDPNGLTTRYHYDILGNLIQTEYPSGVLEDQTLKWVDNAHYHPDTPVFGCPIYFTYTKRSGERESYVFYDQHNRKLREVSCDMAGEKIYVDYKYYNISGILRQVSKPYFHDMNETPTFSTYHYDWLGRNTRIDRADGGFMNKDYVGTTETTIDFDGQKTTLLYTKAGLVEFALSYNSPDNAVASQFSYYGDGKVKTANSITYCYDVNGNPLSVSDPSLGLLTYDYNAFGELVESTTPNDETCYTYDALGRMTQRSGSDGNSYWTYDSGFIGALASTTYIPTNGPIIKEGFLYDQYGHLIQQTQRVGEEEEWTFNYTYNRLGKQSSITYPSGKKVKYHYNSKGFMDYVKDASTDDVLWQANASDRWDNISSFTEGDIDVEYSYDPVTGLVNSIGATRNSQILLNQTYHWTTTGNLDWRTDTTLGLKERFGYDFSNRLTSAITRNLAETQTYSEQDFVYDFRGNITQKTGVGSYAYEATNYYIMTGLQPEAGQEALFTHQEATYTNFDKLKTIEQDGKTLNVNYGIDRQRVMQTFSNGNTTRTKRYFTPLYETVTENGVTKKLHYFTAETGLFAIFATQSNGGSTMHYTLKDHQGNLTATISGNTVERLSYDAWGRRRNPVGFGYSNVTHTFDRGYTLHEHYDDFDLINMNGRLYDPVLGRMLSPDIAIQDEHNSQAYNRYSYCFNNPLRFTDPSGYVVDEWEIDAYGQIINHKKDKTQDVFYLVEKDEKGNYVRVKDENGNYKSIAFEYGTIEKQKTISLASGTYDTYEARGDENGKSLFEFFAEIVRDQGIEVSYAKTGKEGDKGLNFITTSHVTPMSHYDENGVLHKTASEPGMTHLLENKLLYGYTIRELNHSHPLSSKVSSADENFANQVKDIQKKNGYHIPKFYIYVVSSKEYIPFGF